MKILTQILFGIIILSKLLIAQECKSLLSITTDQNDLLIFIDDVYLGNGNVEIELDKGEYKIIIKEPGLYWDAFSIEENISIKDCEQNHSYKYSLENMLLIESNPFDAKVYNENNFLGNTPLFISRDIENIRLDKERYNSQTINVSGIASMKPIKLNFNGEAKTKSFTETPFFEILIGTAVGLGALSAYYKIQADQSFDKYEESKKQKYLDETNRFDNSSAIAFGVLQINIAALIYFLLSSQ